MKTFLWVLRIIIGVVFIFSGVVKANDPMGLVYKMDEFFDVLNMTFMLPYSFIFSVTMIAFEITCGVAVLIGAAFNIFATLLLLLNIFFTFLTGYALYSGKVKECGCFGACIPLSPQATFNKDVFLTIVAIILFIYRSRIKGLFDRHVNTAIMILTVVIAAGIQWWALQHLPFNDCMPYKPGSNIWVKMQPGPDYKPAEIESVFIYEKNGQKKEFTTTTIPWQDSTWKYVDRKDKTIKEATGEPEIHDFILTDSDKNDQTKAVLTAPGYTIFWFVRNPQGPHLEKLDQISKLAAKAKELHIPFYCLCSADMETSMAFMKKIGMANVPVFTLDGTASKTAMRTDPGLMVIKDGLVVQKWSYRDYPQDMEMNGGKLNIK
jgi:uncharacterized membrane protein YphA (DoxX/SURF4 family)